MAVTTTYSLNFVKYLPLELGTQGAPEVISLTNGGLAFAGEHAAGGWHVDGELFNAAGVHGADWSSGGTSFNPSLAQLSNGNIVQFSENGGGELFFEIRSVGGAIVRANADAGVTDSYAPDVTAVSGGFWSASETFISGSNYDIYIDRWNNNGTYQGFIGVDSSGERDTGASIAALSNGNVAVAWTRTFGNGDTEVRYAIYNSSAGVVRASSVLDAFGALNQNVSLCALAGGGFAAAYETDGYDTGTVDINVAIFNNSGAFVREANITDPGEVGDGSDDANPYIAQLANGQLVVAYSDNFYTDTDTIVSLLSLNLDVLAQTSISTLDIDNDAENPTLAGFGFGLIGVFEDSEGENAGEALQATRRSVGDSGDNTITGDFFADIMNGAAGADRLNGSTGDDHLTGAAGDDILSGGGGADTLIGGGGHDRLIGGAGADKFVFNAPAASGHSDVITDFAHNSDKIVLENAVFTAAGAEGVLAANAFWVGASAHDGDDRVIYNAATGDLFYDGNGNAAGQTVLLAKLTAGLTLTNTDIQII